MKKDIILLIARLVTFMLGVVLIISGGNRADGYSIFLGVISLIASTK